MVDDMRIYAKFGASLYENPKVLTLALDHPTAYRVWTFAICYAVRNLTDGFVPSVIAGTSLAASADDIEQLEDAGFFEPDELNGIPGWRIHDYLESQGRSRADVEDAKSKRAEAARRAGVASARARSERKSNVDSTNVQRMGNGDVDESLNERSNERSTEGQRSANGDVERTLPDRSNVSATESNPDTDTDTDTSKKEKTSFSPKKTRKTKIRRTFQLDRESIEHAKRLRLDPNRERNRFVDWWLKDGGMQADWQATFRGWCDHSPDAKIPKPPEPPSEAWIQSHVLEWLPESVQLDARRRFLDVFRESGDRDRAAQVVQSEFGGES